MPRDGARPGLDHNYAAEVATLDAADLARLDPRELAELELLIERERYERRRRGKIYELFPDDGPLRRALYAKHLEFFRAGKLHRERMFCAANRIGKTEGGGLYETALHLTGHYPPWWAGRVFDHPVDVWAAGKTNVSTRDILQTKAFGAVQRLDDGSKTLAGTGLVPGDDIGAMTWNRAASGDLIDTVYVKHRTNGVVDGWSVLGFKSFEQGRGAFEGTEKHVVLLDEEPPIEVYTECLIRTMTTRGLVMLTFTPLEGLSEVVLSFLPGGEVPEQEPV